MNLKLTTAAIAVLVVLPVSAAASATSSYLVDGTKSIGGYHVGANYTQAKDLFGFPRSSSFSGTACTAVWRNGVTIVWSRTRPFSSWAKACVKFSRAKVGRASIGGAAWRTDKGLRVGAKESQIKKLYPSAASTRSSAYTVWTLDKTAKVSLQAWVKAGRVSYFRLAGS